MAFTVQTEAPPLSEDATGALRIGNSHVLLEIVVRAFQRHSRDDRPAVFDLGTIRCIRCPRLLFTAPYRGRGVPARRDQKANEVRQRIESQQAALSFIRARLLTKRPA